MSKGSLKAKFWLCKKIFFGFDADRANAKAFTPATGRRNKIEDA
jgi:hypothetical protein